MKITVAVVAYNEEKCLSNVLNDICAQDYPLEKIEVILVDSCSKDGTKAIMEKFAKQHNEFYRVAVFDNPQKILPCGCNVVLKNYTGDALVRIDAHASVPSDFISKNVKVLSSGENVSGGQRPNIIDEETAWKRTLLAAEQSMFGSSIASYRHSQKRSYVSSIFHGMYRREVYDKVGLYDERLARTEDNDMSCRIREAGYNICYDPDIISYQHTRSSLKGMLRQKYLNGYWIGKTMGINPRCFSLFHFVPLAFVMAIIITSIMLILGWPWLSGLMWGAYSFLMLVMTVVEIIREPSAFKILLPVLFFLLHISYGVGTLFGLIEMPFWAKKVKKQ